MYIDRGAALRRRKPEQRARALEPRPDAALTSVADLPAIGPIALLADTSIDIDNAAGRLSPTAAGVLDRAILFHCSVCLAEIAVRIANANPAHRAWNATGSLHTEILDAIPRTRVLTPDAQTRLEAGLVAGTLSRTRTVQPHRRKAMLNDALILLTAAKAGLAVLTPDRDHYDLLRQLCPETRFILA